MATDIHVRLENWGDAMRIGFRTQTCGSIEKKHRSNWRQWVLSHEIQIQKYIDYLDADAVEQAWKQCQHRNKVILKLTYIWRPPEYIVAQRARVKIWHLDIHKGKALDEIIKHLTR